LEAAHFLGREEGFGPVLPGVEHAQPAGSVGHGAEAPGVIELKALACRASTAAK